MFKNFKIKACKNNIEGMALDNYEEIINKYVLSDIFYMIYCTIFPKKPSTYQIYHVLYKKNVRFTKEIVTPVFRNSLSTFLTFVYSNGKYGNSNTDFNYVYLTHILAEVQKQKDGDFENESVTIEQKH